MVKSVPTTTEKNITRLLPFAMLLMLRTRNNTDGNKLVIFSDIIIALYYGDNYIIIDFTGGRDDKMYIGQSPAIFPQ